MEARDYLTGSVSCVLKRGEELLLSEIRDILKEK